MLLNEFTSVENTHLDERQALFQMSHKCSKNVSVKQYFMSIIKDPSESTHRRWKYHCTVDLLFNWFGFDQTSKVDANST